MTSQEMTAALDKMLEQGNQLREPANLFLC